MRRRAGAGPGKIWLDLNRGGTPVACCTVERRMAAVGLRGVTRQFVVAVPVYAQQGHYPGDRIVRLLCLDQCESVLEAFRDTK